MSRLSFVLVLTLVLTTLVLTLKTAKAEMRNLPSVTVLAPFNLNPVITELTKIYARQNEMTVSAAFETSEVLTNHIVEGRTADVFISSHPRWIHKLKQNGLLDVFSLTNLVEGQLAFIATEESAIVKEVKNQDFQTMLTTLQEHTIPIIINSPDDSLGLYTAEALTTLKDRYKWEPFTINSSSVKETLYLLSKGNNIGITYNSDIYRHPHIHILRMIPDDTQSPIIYQAAVVAGENMVAAREFLRFLKSEQAKEVFRRYQFKVN